MYAYLSKCMEEYIYMYNVCVYACMKISYQDHLFACGWELVGVILTPTNTDGVYTGTNDLYYDPEYSLWYHQRETNSIANVFKNSFFLFLFLFIYSFYPFLYFRIYHFFNDFLFSFFFVFLFYLFSLF